MWYDRATNESDSCLLGLIGGGEACKNPSKNLISEYSHISGLVQTGSLAYSDARGCISSDGHMQAHLEMALATLSLVSD